MNSTILKLFVMALIWFIAGILVGNGVIDRKTEQAPVDSFSVIRSVEKGAVIGSIMNYEDSVTVLYSVWVDTIFWLPEYENIKNTGWAWRIIIPPKGVILGNKNKRSSKPIEVKVSDLPVPDSAEVSP